MTFQEIRFNAIAVSVLVILVALDVGLFFSGAVGSAPADRFIL